jgi:tRNA pseudouridine38-40 synthase
MPRYLIRICYDGTGFHGWQKQNGRRNVQDEMERVLTLITGSETRLTASGRTDAGVHALAQYAHFDSATSLTLKQMLLALRSKLPDDISVPEIWKVGDDFHARYQVMERTYLYLLARQRTPFNRHYTGWMRYREISVPRMVELASVLGGVHDFSSFSKDNPDIPNHVCDLQELKIEDKGETIEFHLRADRFLHNMVRRIVGTLVNFSRMGLDRNELDRLLREENPRQRLVITAPASGLYLTHVRYPNLPLDGSAGHTSLTPTHERKWTYGLPDTTRNL